jgi:arylsulfatase A-like enzyme
MKADAWEAGHRVPFIVRWPRRVPAGAVSNATICFTDMLDTLAAVTGEAFEPDRFPDSYSFASLLGAAGSSSAGTPRPYLPIRSGAGMMTIRRDGWKLIDGLGSGGFSSPRRIKPQPGGPRGQLYHLDQDLAETQNLYQQRPERVAELRKLLEEVLAKASQHE